MENLEVVDFSSNSISSAEKLILPAKLKICNLSDNVLRRFCVKQWPERLVELDLSYNRLEELDSSFDDLVRTCVVSVNYNDFPPQKYNAYTVWLSEDLDGARLSAEVARVNRFARFGVSVRVRSTCNSESPIDSPRRVRQCPRIKHRLVVRSTYADSQNVHASSVQNSVDEAVAWLMENASCSTEKSGLTACKQLKRAWRPRRFYHVREWLRTRRANRCLKTNMMDRTIHLRHGITYEELIRLVWIAVKTHPHRIEILTVLKKEIVDSSHLCFTGRFTRALSSLGGFIDEIQVGISETEQISNRVVHALKKVTAQHKEGTPDYEQEGRRQVAEILDEYNVVGQQRQAWLDAV